MNKIGLVMPYYDNPLMLRKHIDQWMVYSPEAKRRIQFIIVDDCTPQTPAANVFLHAWGSARPLDFMVYRVQVDQPWGQDAARNIGMKHVEALWSLMTDMDHVLNQVQVEKMIRFVDDVAYRGHYYLPARVKANMAQYHRHPNTFLFHKEDFWNMGGYDEDFVGHYGSDGNFRKCAMAAGLFEQYVDAFKLVLVGTNDVPDCNTRAYTRKDGPLWAARDSKLNAKRMGPGYRAVHPFRMPYSRVL
jgi:hypothetical protein